MTPIAHRVARAWIRASLLDVWRERLAREAQDLDLHDAEDRTVFRTRVLKAFAQARVSVILDVAASLKATPRDRSRASAARAVADAWIAQSG